MRVTTAFNRILGFPGTVVESVSFTDSGIVIGLRLRSKDLVCPCGRVSRARYDISRRRWRHLDFGTAKVFLEADIRRVDCRGCGQVRTEWMPWARPGARHSHDFEDMVGWLAQRMDKTNIAVLMRSSWQTVDAIVGRLVGEHLDNLRLDKVYRIGVDEIAYKGRNCLTVVADHDSGNVLWVAEGRTRAALHGFFDALGIQGRANIEAVSMDMGHIYREETRDTLPRAAICFDPFHVIKWAGEALDQTHLASPRTATALHVQGVPPPRVWQKVRSTLRAGAENLDETGHAILDQLRLRQKRLFRAWQLKENLRELYRSVKPVDADAYLKRWCTAAIRSRINAFVALGRRIRRHFNGVIAAVHKGMSNSLLEGINSGIRLIQRRAHGLASVDSLTTMIHLCHGGIATRLPR